MQNKEILLIPLRALLQHIVCPFGIIRGIIILVVARLLLHPAQSFIFSTVSRFELFLFLAGFMDIFSRTSGLISELYGHKNKGGAENLELILLKTVRALLLSNYGGLLLVPVWFGCVVVYTFVRARAV
jgi:hypothetical protein